jgi:hypothetical protein
MQTMKAFLTLCKKGAMFYLDDPYVMIELLRIIEHIVSSIYLDLI